MFYALRSKTSELSQQYMINIIEAAMKGMKKIVEQTKLRLICGCLFSFVERGGIINGIKCIDHAEK